MDVFMRDSDAFTWYMERDPALRSTVVVVAWLDGRPDWDTLVARLDRVTRLVPSFRKKVVVPPARLATPRWTVDDGFDLSWHLRRVDSPEPHTPGTVLAMARNAAMAAFDPAHPLWEFTLVEHLEGDRAALVMKLHHSLTDGVGGMELALLLFDLERDAVAPADAAAAPEPEPLGTGAMLRGCAGHAWSRGVEAVDGLNGMFPSAWDAARHPFERIGEVVETARSVVRTVAPVRDTKSPVMRERGLGRHLEMLEVRLDDLKRAAAVAGGTVNDGYFAAIAAGFRRYHERHGAPVDELRVTLPISIRTARGPGGRQPDHPDPLRHPGGRRRPRGEHPRDGPPVPGRPGRAVAAPHGRDRGDAEHAPARRRRRHAQARRLRRERRPRVHLPRVPRGRAARRATARSGRRSGRRSTSRCCPTRACAPSA